MKQRIKYFVGYIRCMINLIPLKNGEKVYIGKRVKIIGGGKIYLKNGVSIRPDVDLWCAGDSITIGSGTEIGERTRISIAHKLDIEESVLVSPNVYITDCDHAYEDVTKPIIEQGIVNRYNCVRIKRHAYIGINSVIVGNVTIGEGSVIGANSVVTKDVPDFCVAVGSPAKVIKKYNFESEKWERV